METTRETLNGIKLGDIFVSLWGYDQTNADYYQVVAFSGKSTLILKCIGAEIITDGNMVGRSRPVKDTFISNKTISKRIKPGATGFNISSYAYARLHTPGDSYHVSWYA